MIFLLSFFRLDGLIVDSAQLITTLHSRGEQNSEVDRTNDREAEEGQILKEEL